MARTVIAIFDSFTNAESAAGEIREKGLRTDNISIITKDNGNNSYNHQNAGVVISNGNAYLIQKEKREKISDGIVTGGILGGITGIILGAGSMLFSGLEIVSASIPIMGLVFGLITGGILGALLGINIPKEKSYEYERMISDGNTFFSMKVDEDRMDQIMDILKSNYALLIEKY